MFRSKIFEPILTGNPYRIFIEGLKSPVTKAAYTFALQKYMKYLKIDSPDNLLEYQNNPTTATSTIGANTSSLNTNATSSSSSKG